MKKASLLLMVLLVCGIAICQKPQLSIHAGAGTWRGWIPDGDPYAFPYQRWQTFAHAGVGVDFPLVEHLYFSPELGLEAYRHHYLYFHRGNDKAVTAAVTLFYSGISPGLKLHLRNRLELRLGLNILIATGAAGTYRLDWSDPSTQTNVHVSYVDRFARIRNAGTLGPEINVGYAFSLKNGSRIAPRMSAFMACVPPFRDNLGTPFNPSFARLSMEISYTFPNKTP